MTDSSPVSTAPVEVIDALPDRPPELGAPPPQEVLLEVRNLRTLFHVMDGVVPAVDGVSFSLNRGETLGIVGESGSGKSVTALTIMRLLDIPPAEIASGEIWFDGKEVLSMPMDDMRRIRGNDMAMIFQEPLTSLNPVFTVGDQIAEQVQLHLKTTKKEAWDRAIESLQLVGIPSPERRVKQYPHEMSGGMRQRVMIAMGLSCEPKLLIADEPTTALDVTIQAQILELLKSIQERTDSALLLITHDLGVVAEMVDDVIVMYAGQVVEQGTAEQVLLDPEGAVHDGPARIDPDRREAGGPPRGHQGRRAVAVQPAAGLPLRAALPYAWEACREIVPPLVATRNGNGQLARCHLETEVGASRRVAAHEAHDLALDPKPDAALTGGME